jgi:hypothetical protein
MLRPDQVGSRATDGRKCERPTLVTPCLLAWPNRACEEFRMAHCFRWKIILSRTKRLGIDTSDHMLYQRDAQHFWLGALNSRQQPPHTHYPAMAAATVRITR